MPVGRAFIRVCCSQTLVKKGYFEGQSGEGMMEENETGEAGRGSEIEECIELDCIARDCIELDCIELDCMEFFGDAIDNGVGILSDAVLRNFWRNLVKPQLVSGVSTP